MVAALDRLRDAIDAPRRLADYGLTDNDIAEAVKRILAVSPPSNPTPVTEDGLTTLLGHALTGAAPVPVTRATR